MIGNEHGAREWGRGVAGALDGDHWYWSSQSPWSNPASFDQLAALASAVTAEDKLWLAPVAPGFNRANFGLGRSCVPRRGTETLEALFHGNTRVQPDYLLVISWNEFLENTYVQPTRRYGTTAVDALAELLAR